MPASVRLLRRHLILEPNETPLVTCLHHLAHRRGRRGEAGGQAILAGDQTETECNMGLASVAGTKGDDIHSSLNPFASGQFQLLHLVELGDGGEVEAVEALARGNLVASIDQIPGSNRLEMPLRLLERLLE